jgi:hypothetical protein
MQIEFASDFLNILKYKISWLKSIQWESSCTMQMDGWTDMMKLIVTFQNFANAPTKGSSNTD